MEHRGKRATAGHHDGVVAALLPRHGADTRRIRDPAVPARRTGRHLGTPGGADEPRGVPAEAGPLDAAAGDQHPLMVGCAELRVRAGGPADLRCRPGRAGPRRCARHHQWQRTNPLARPSGGSTSASPSSTCPTPRCAPPTGWPRRRCTWSPPDRALPATVRFDYEKLSAGHAEAVRRRGRFGAGQLRRPAVVDAAHRRSRDPVGNPDGKIGEIWVHGDKVAMGYWRNPQPTERTFGGELVDPSPGTPRGRGCAPATSA